MDFSFNAILSSSDLGNTSETTKSEDFEAMESRILEFLDKNGVEFTNPSEHWSKKKKNHLRISSDSEGDNNSPMIKRLSLSCPLFLKRKNKN